MKTKKIIGWTLAFISFLAMTYIGAYIFCMERSQYDIFDGFVYMSVVYVFAGFVIGLIVTIVYLIFD